LHRPEQHSQAFLPGYFADKKDKVSWRAAQAWINESFQGNIIGTKFGGT
jgi:hypothetical protein